MSLKTLEISVSEKKVERTVEHTDTVVTVKPYTTEKKNLQGLEFKLKGLPYPVRVLTKDLPALFVGSKVRFTGIMQTYEGKEYFRPMDVEVVEQSNISKLAVAGVSWSGNL
jgi:hypothetical protein